MRFPKGGIRRHPYQEGMTLEAIKKLALTIFKEGWSEDDFAKAKVGNFKSEPIVEESGKPFIIDEYLKKHGLFASRVKFYLLTDDVLTELISQEDDGEELEDETFRMEARENPTLEESNKRLLISGKPLQNLDIQFISCVISKYSGQLSYAVISGWDNAYEMRSDECLDLSKDVYDPLKDKFFVGEIKINNVIYLQRKGDTNTGDITFSDTEDKPHDPSICYGPDTINGYHGDNLIIGVITNFHNELGVMYTWYKDEHPICNGHNQCIIKVEEVGTYTALVEYGDKVCRSEPVTVVLEGMPTETLQSSTLEVTTTSAGPSFEPMDVRQRYVKENREASRYVIILLDVYICSK